VGKSSKERADGREIRNRKAHHEYFIGETFEAGIVLSGPEVKSLRAGDAQIGDAFVRTNGKGELLLCNANIAEYKFCQGDERSATRFRKLLLHRSEIRKILIAMEREKMAVIPLRMLFKHGLAKVEVALCKGKKLFDKREALKRKEALREAAKAMASRRWTG
jgi:SsrA-binding protein